MEYATLGFVYGTGRGCLKSIQRVGASNFIMCNVYLGFPLYELLLLLLQFFDLSHDFLIQTHERIVM
jgi:hypothetical protein